MSAELSAEVLPLARTHEHRRHGGSLQHLLEGRVRLGGLHPVVRWLVVTGLVLIGALLVSMLVAPQLRHGALVEVRSTAEGSRFIPTSVFPFTMLGFFVAWTLIVAAVTYAAPTVRIAVALAFVIVNSMIAHPVVLTLSHASGIVVGEHVVRACYFAVPGLLVLLTVLSPAKRLHDKLRPAVIVLLALAVLGIFGGMTWIHVTGVAHGAPASMPELVDGSVLTLNVLAFPLLYIAQLSVTKFAYERVALPLASAGWWQRVPVTAAKLGVLAFIAVRIALRASTAKFREALDIRHDLGTVGMTVGVAAVACLVAWAFRRLHAATDEVQTEKVVLKVAVAKAVPQLATMCAIGALAFSAGQWPHSGLVRRLSGISLTPIYTWGPLVIWPLLLVWAVVMYARGRANGEEAAAPGEHGDGYRGDAATRQAAFGLALIAVWGTLAALMTWRQSYVLVSKSVLDVLLLVACAAFVVARWRALDTVRCARVAGLVMFAWMWLDPLGANWLSEVARATNALITHVGWVIPEVGVVVVGIVLSLLTESAFTNGRSRRFPRPSRVLLWVGYFSLSLVLTNWAYVSGSAEGEGIILDAAYYLALPFGAWLVMAGRFRRPERAEGEEGEEAEAPAVDLYVFR